MPILFYTTGGEFGCFSNFSPHGFELGGNYWRTSEHYFQAQKFVGTEWEEVVRRAHSPKEAANLGRDKSKPLRPDWEVAKDAVMRAAVEAKFRTHSSIRDILLETGNENLIENSPYDYYWGCGKDGSGKNMLGRILMEIRDELRRKTSS